jgi:recombination protein RecR
MSRYPASVIQVIKHFSKLPGIGEKSAERLAMHLLRMPQKEVESLARSIVDMKQKVQLCSLCFGLSDQSVCHICANPARDPRVLCVVEQPADMVCIEKTNAFYGLYHVLHGVLSPMEGVGPENIRFKELIGRIESGEVKEVVIATGTSVEGDTTAVFLAEKLSGFGIIVTRIASGVPVGGDLKYVDPLTLKRAMETRHAI